jgi:hypothetical protein
VDVTKYRLVYVGLALALVAVVAVAWAFGSPPGRDIGLPEPLEAVSPIPGETALRQARLEVDLPVGYRVELFVDGRRVPESEVTRVAATGVYSWEPGPGRMLPIWSPGDHTVRITWDTESGLPDPGQFEWTFRVF